MQGQGRSHRTVFAERSIERLPAETHSGSESVESDARLGQHLRIDVDGFHATDAFVFQYRFGQSARSRAEVEYQHWADIGDFVSGSGQAFFVARNECANRRIVSIDVKAKMAADRVAHRLIVAKLFFWSKSGAGDPVGAARKTWVRQAGRPRSPRRLSGASAGRRAE